MRKAQHMPGSQASKLLHNNNHNTTARKRTMNRNSKIIPSSVVTSNEYLRLRKHNNHPSYKMKMLMQQVKVNRRQLEMS